MYLKSLKVGFEHLRPLRWLALVCIVLIFGTSLMEGVGLGVLVPILQQMQHAGGTPGADLFSRYSYLVLSFFGVQYSFLSLVLLFSVLMFTKFALQAALEISMKYLSASTKCSLRRKIYDALLSVPVQFYHRRPAGQLIATAHTSADEAGALVESVVQVAAGLLAILIFVGMQVIISPQLTGISLAVTAISYYFIVPRFRTAFYKGGDVKAITDRIVSYLHETISGIRTVKAFRREEKHRKEVDNILGDFLRTVMGIQVNKVFAGLLMEPVSTAVVVILMLVSVLYLKLQLALLLTFFVLLIRLAMKFRDVNTHYLYIAQNLPHFLKVQEVIDAKSAEVGEDGAYVPRDVEGDIQFSSVSFQYEGRREYALRDVNLVIGLHRTTALAGASGGGKTTVVDLLLKHIAPIRGRITIGDHFLSEISTDKWLDLIGVVEQEPFLFHASVAENIGYGKPGATKEEIEGAARLANAYGFISMLPDGYETIVGDRGVTLSGGERQRIALARALIKDPEILILDEATSALDSVAERLIHDSIEQFRHSKTILVIAHRLSTVMNADEIVLLEDGQVVEAGSHDELIERGGLYARNYALQGLQVGPAKGGGLEGN